MKLQDGNLFRVTLRGKKNSLRFAPGKVCLLLVTWVSFVGATFAGVMLHAAPPATIWLTGSQLQTQLDSTVSLKLSGQPLRDSLEHIAEAYQVAIFLDRRVDPGQLFELQVTNVSLQKALDTLAEQQNLGTSLVGSTIYIGPVDAAKDILTLAMLARDEVEVVPKTKRASLQKLQPLAWKALTTPGELFEQTAGSAELKLIGVDRVPHDLWPAGSWPPMSVTDRLTLLAIGFDLQIRVSKAGDAVALVPRVTPARIVRSYSAGAKSDEISRKFAEYLPDAEFKTNDGKLFVRARWEDQLRVQAALKGKPLTRTIDVKEEDSAATSGGIRVYTLSVQNKPLRPVLETLARQMNMVLQMDDKGLKDSGVDPEQLISFQVKGAQRDELWEAALSPIGLSFHVEGDTILVSPARK